MKLWKPLAEQGDAEAQSHLGGLYYDEETGLRNLRESAKWNRKAAEQGHPIALVNMGIYYANGWGVPQDYVFAYMWHNLALVFMQSTPDAWFDLEISARKDLAEKMTPAQIAEAQRLSREWYEEFQKRSE